VHAYGTACNPYKYSLRVHIWRNNRMYGLCILYITRSLFLYTQLTCTIRRSRIFYGHIRRTAPKETIDGGCRSSPKHCQRKKRRFVALTSTIIYSESYSNCLTYERVISTCYFRGRYENRRNSALECRVRLLLDRNRRVFELTVE